ncbi:MAG: DUF3047 domain-containing protein [Thiothrix sp.]|nr:DUF3047 domain-containing protein [Thiothrix sp.]HPQ97064.1 DUF3047 domain-containing protein [Thiolinea sp.]
MKNMKKMIALVAALCCSTFVHADVMVGEFSKGQMARGSSGWEVKVFSGNTNYNLGKDGRTTVLMAKSNGTASGLIRKIRVDLTKTPILNWSWRIDGRLAGLDERTKNGDDYAARIYLILDGGLMPWNSLALNYVWSSNTGRGQSWDNALMPKNAKMIAARGKADPVGKWVRERRNVRADFKRAFGQDIKFIDAVAIMTDSDNSRRSASAAYGDIYFTAR